MKYELVIVGTFETNCYLVYDEDTFECAIVDPGAEPEKIFPVITEFSLKPVLILNTHGHVDHVGANLDMKERFSVPLWIHSLDNPLLEAIKGSEMSLFLGAKDSPLPDKFLKDRETISIGKVSLKVVHTPGHTPGSVGFYGHGTLFSGDTLFCGGVGRTDLAGGSRKDLEKSIRSRIHTLPAETVVLPGHGPWTTVGQEIVSNPDLT